MTKEEQDAIRSAKCEIETEKEVGCIFAKWLSVKELEVILNLIDNLQKENKELRIINKIVKIAKEDLPDETEFIVLTKECFENNYNYISKDKIRNKIEVIEEEYSKTLEKKDMPLEFHNINAQRYNAIKLVLEELLEEN